MTSTVENTGSNAAHTPDEEPQVPYIPGLAYAVDSKTVLPQHVSSTTRYRADRSLGVKLPDFVSQEVLKSVISQPDAAPEHIEGTPETTGFRFHLAGLLARVKEAFHSSNPNLN